MPSAVVPNARVASHDQDDHEYDDAIEELFKDLPIDRNGADHTTAALAEPAKDIDQEIKVKKQRRPNPKLDEALLLSHNGLSRLRRITKSRLRFKGKGHEFSNISTLLNTYQLWLDDLYPRAKFKDALLMVEKVGHSKRMKVMRKAWLDDTKPFRKDGDGDADAEEPCPFAMSGALPSVGSKEATNGARGDGEDIIFVDDEQPQGPKESNLDYSHSNGGPDEDELDALLAEYDSVKAPAQPQKTSIARGPFEEDSDEDELDALLAAELQPPANTTSQSNTTTKATLVEDDFADEEEIIAGMDMW